MFDTFIDGWDGTFHGEGTPYIYTTYERTIFLFPPPDIDAVEGLKILYSKKPVDVALITDDLNIPDTYHTSIVKYCMAEATTMDEEIETSAFHRSQFQINIDKLSYQNEVVAQETYPIISTRPEDDW